MVSRLPGEEYKTKDRRLGRACCLHISDNNCRASPSLSSGKEEMSELKPQAVEAFDFGSLCCKFCVWMIGMVMVVVMLVKEVDKQQQSSYDCKLD